MSFWAAQIWATARVNQSQVIFSEDFSSEQIDEGVRLVIPFTEEF